MKRTIAAALIVLATPSVAQAQTLTVYSSLPLSGFPNRSTKAINTGAQIALRQSGNATVRLETLNSGNLGDGAATTIAVRRDDELYGRGLAADIRAAAARLGVKIVGLRRAKCMVYAGLTASGAAGVFRTAPKKILLFGGDGVGTAGFASQLPRSVAKRTFVTADVLAPANYGLPKGSDAYLAFGYEAMKLILDGIAAGATTKPALIAWLHTVQNRPSALGTYGFDANGDTTLRTIGLYRISNYALRFVGPITAA